MSVRRSRKDDDSIQAISSKKSKNSSFIPLPDELVQTGGLINVRNTEDEECFKWSVLAALHPEVNDAENFRSYLGYENELKFYDLNFPISKKKIPQFENYNNIGINLFGYENAKENNPQKIIFPALVTKETFLKTVDLFYVTNEDTWHYCWIKDFSALMGNPDKHFCRFCLEGYDALEGLQSHTRLCQLFEPQIIEFPPEDRAVFKIKFPHFILKAPYVIYADFECIQPPSKGDEHIELDSKVKKLTDHIPSGYAYKVVGLTEKDSKPMVLFRGDRVIERFMEAMSGEMSWVQKKLDERKKSNSKRSKNPDCYICKDFLGRSQYEFINVNEHCIYKICWQCNENYNEKLFVVFHNLTGYDGHFLLADKDTVQKITFSIHKSIEKCTAFNTGSLRFIDSRCFLKDSIETLVSNLLKNTPDMKQSFKHTLAFVENKDDEEKLKLLLQKQVYPYDYMDSVSKFEETRLPDKTEFKRKLTDEDISEKDYTRAKKVWDAFNIKNLGEYHDLYVKLDVSLLVDVFENFRKLCREKYLLDPAYFYSLAGLSWTAAFKKTKPKLDLLTDREMYLMIESGIRGGVAMVSHRFAKANYPPQADYDGSKRSAKANNPLLQDYDGSKPNTYIIYLDANNLYGWAMSQFLPTGEFKWLTPEEIEQFHIEDKQIDADTGYILEVDLEYLEDLHDHHNDYPLAPEKIVISSDMLSPFTKELFSRLDKNDSHEPKLVPNLRDKEKYVVHYRALKLYLELGLKLKKIYRIVSFNQSPWLKPYIDYNTERRKEATNKSDSDMLKLMNNSFYGKTFENIRKYRDVIFPTQDKEKIDQARKLNYEEVEVLAKDVIGIRMKKLKITLNKPIYIGFSVLDISKTLIYDFHYNFIRQKYKDKARLLFTDTDSLCYEIQTDYIYDDILKEADRFDTSDYPQGHQVQSDVNKKVVGKMKDETHGVPISEFVGLRPKMYSLKYGDSGKKCAVGVDKNYRERKLSHEDYKKCLETKEETEIEQVKITSILHQVHTVRERRVGLSPYDEKRYVMDDGITTLAYGHKKTSAVDVISSLTSV